MAKYYSLLRSTFCSPLGRSALGRSALSKSGLVLLLCNFLLLGLSSSTQAAEGIELPRTIAWSAYPTGTGGYSQAVAIGNILQRRYKVNLRVIPGRNDVSRLATLRAGRVHFSAGGSEAVYAQEGILNFASRKRLLKEGILLIFFARWIDFIYQPFISI